MKNVLTLLPALLLSVGFVNAMPADTLTTAPADTTATDSTAVVSRASSSIGSDNSSFSPAPTLDAIVTAPSPEAAAMTRHVDEDVDFASGTAGLHIPLFEWQSGDLAVSLSLSHAIGPHKVDEQPGSLGLGWSMSGAGCVTRHIVGFPDEAKPLDIRSTAAITADPDGWKYLIDIDEYRKEASLDRYSYSCPGGSGSFVVIGEKIIQTPQSDINIAFTGNLRDGVRDFIVSTPDRTRYFFTEREHIDYHYKPATITVTELPNYNNAVSTWHLTSIISPEGADTVSYVYEPLPQWTRDKVHKSNTYSFYRYNWSGIEKSVWSGNSSVHDHAVTTFRDQKLLQSIISRAATATFVHEHASAGSGHSTPAILKTITITSPEGRSVRDISLDYASSDKIRTLRHIEIRSEGKLLDAHNFAYGGWTTESQKDFFGYPNPLIGNDASQSIIDPFTGEFNEDRRYYPHSLSPKEELHFQPYLSPQKGELREHSTAAGLLTRYSYEPSAMTYIRRNFSGTPLDTFNLAIGSRLRSIETIDSVTLRRRIREFSYSDPMCTIDFDNVSFGDFVSISGTAKVIDRPGDPLQEIIVYSNSVTFHDSSLAPGHSPHNARIYYGTVEERISGSDVDNPVMTRRCYDTSPCRLDFVSACNGSFDHFSEIALRDERYPALASPPFNAPEGVFKAMGRNAALGGSFTEKPGAAPLLISATSFSGTEGSYSPLAESVFTYSSHDENSTLTSVYQHKNVRDLIPASLIPQHGCKKLSDLDFCVASLTSSRFQCDSVVSTRYFPDGSKRVSTTSNIYTTSDFWGFTPLSTARRDTFQIIGPITLSPFPGDSIRLSASYRMHFGTRTTEGGHTMEHYIARADNVSSSFFSRAANRGRHSLPVREMWVVDGRDTITRSWEYGIFNGVARPTAITLTGADGTVIARQNITGYNSRGLPTGLRELGAPERTFSWDRYNMLASITEGTPDGPRLVSSFTNSPLVGCTAATAPDGSVTKFTYQGGRLIRVTGPDGFTTTEYAYGLRNDGSDTPGRNFVMTKTYIKDRATLLTDPAITETIYDGFGLSVAEIARGFGSGNTDVVTMTRYDALHRPTAGWRPLPLTDIEAALASDSPLEAASAALFGGDTDAVSRYTYPRSALTQPASVSMPGKDFAGAASRFETQCSTTQMRDLSRAVVRFSFDGSVIRSDDFYSRGDLDCIRSTDPDGRVTLTFTDPLGRTVLVRRLTGSYSYADTYIISDSWGNPLVVLPPEAAAEMNFIGGEWSLADEIIDRYAYVYSYDKALRPRSAKTPGCQPVRYAYDSDGRLCFTRDGNQAACGRRSFIACDQLGRLAVAGTCDDALSDDIWDSDLSATTPPLTLRRSAPVGTGFLASGYTGLPSSGIYDIQGASLLNASFYDDHTFLPDSLRPVFDPAFPDPIPPVTYPGGITLLPTETESGPAESETGRRTGSLTAVLGHANDAPPHPLLSVERHNSKGQTIRSISRAIDGSLLTVSVKPSFGGLPLSTVVSVDSPQAETLRAHRTDHTYDRFGRTLTSRLTLDAEKSDSSLLLAAVDYDELGHPSRSQSEGGFCRLTETDIRGNISHWEAAGISQNILYGDRGRYRSFSGRIIAKSTLIDGIERRYDYLYSDLGFLSQADFSSSASDSSATLPKDFSTAYEYDRQANLRKITRHGSSAGILPGKTTTHLTLEGNQLISTIGISDRIPLESDITINKDFLGEPLPILPWIAGKDRAYDHNGNLTHDRDRNIVSITYNDINRPMCIRFTNGNEIRYLYSASGEKLAERHISADGTADRCRLWVGGYEIVDGSPVRLLLPQGYVDLDSPALSLYIPDHQGNIVGVYDCASQSLVQTTDYYPYGLPHNDAVNPQLQRHKFGAKELLTEFGLAEYDFNARRAIAAVASFSQPDPLAGALTDPQSGRRLAVPYLSGISPYAYCAADPINLIDPTGKYTLVNCENYFSSDILAIFPSYVTQSGLNKSQATIRKDYIAAKDSNVPILLVDNVEDMRKAFSEVASLSRYPFITINEHGSPGILTIGNETIDITYNLTDFKECFILKTIFIGECNVGQGVNGQRFIELLAEESYSTIIAPEHAIASKHEYTGAYVTCYVPTVSEEGTLVYKVIPRSSKCDPSGLLPSFFMSVHGAQAGQILDVALDRLLGIGWSNGPRPIIDFEIKQYITKLRK